MKNDNTDQSKSNNQNEIDPNKKYNFFLACLELTFIDADKETGITRVNTMITSETDSINITLLGRAQQAAQIQLMKQLNDEQIQIINVIFTSISNLGNMTNSEFHQKSDEVHEQASEKQITVN